MLGLDAEVNPPQSYITEIHVPKLENQIIHTREIHDNFTVYNRTPLTANVTPKFTFVDAHHGISSVQMSSGK